MENKLPFVFMGIETLKCKLCVSIFNDLEMNCDSSLHNSQEDINKCRQGIVK